VNPHWAPFLGVVVLAYVIPGPDFAVIVRAATSGRRSGALAALGAQAGLSVHMLAATAGLSLLLARSPIALTVIQLAGAAYLIYLGVRAIVASRRSTTDPATNPKDTSGRSWFAQGILTNLLNPKAVLFFVSILPQFVNRDAPLPPQILALGAVDILIGIVVWAALIAATSRFTATLHQPKKRRLWDRATGSIFIAIGITLALTHA